MGNRGLAGQSVQASNCMPSRGRTETFLHQNHSCHSLTLLYRRW